MTMMIFFASAGGTTLPEWPAELAREQADWPLIAPLSMLIVIGAIVTVALRRRK